MWFKLQYPEYYGLLFAVPNGAHVSNSQRKILTAEGMISGVSDMILLMAREGYHGLMLELKVGRNTQSDHQKRWEKMVEAQGYLYRVIRSFDHFKETVDTYIGENSEKYNQRIMKNICK